jgi:hypothetical protein
MNRKAGLNLLVHAATAAIQQWAERKSDYTGINPLQCPNCDKPLTFIGCFFGNWKQLQHLFEKAGKDTTIPAALL